jgi:hypothetical protein
MKTNLHFLSYLAHLVLKREVFLGGGEVEKIKTHILFSVIFFENCAIYEIKRKNIVEPDRPQMTVWYLHIVCWITKATNTHSEQAYVILIAFPWQQLLHKCTSVLRL